MFCKYNQIIENEEKRHRKILKQIEEGETLNEILEMRVKYLKDIDVIYKQLNEKITEKENELQILKDYLDIFKVDCNGNLVAFGKIEWDHAVAKKDDLTNLITRLYVKGKDSLSIENLPTDKYHTYGKPYIECFDYFKENNYGFNEETKEYFIREAIFEKPECNNIFELYAEAVAYLLSHCGK